MANILIIDDDEALCDILSRRVKQMGHEHTCAYTLEEGYRKASSGSYDVVFLDVGLPDGNGLDALPRIRSLDNCPEVIIFTGQGDPDGAELAIKSGAWDYIAKPPSLKEIVLPLSRALQYREEKKRNSSKILIKTEGIVGNSSQMQTALNLLAQAASSDVTTLLTGETGTGKELFATAIHANSDRASKDFVVVDCAALPDTLVESVLFGHEKGAFTGADKAHPGLVKQADGGTLFLDEVGELPLSLQKPFLRVLQERRFRPVGSQKEVTSNFRLVAATNRNLEELAEAKLFRQDLLYRLKTLTIDLPSLRSRAKDVKELTIFYMGKLCERYGKGTKGFSPEFMEALTAYEWPGNVRELINALERTLIASAEEPTLFPNHLPTHIRVKLARESLRQSAIGKNRHDIGAPPQDLPSLKDYRDAIVSEAEAKYLEDLMLLTSRDILAACDISGLSRSRLYHLLQKHGIKGSR
ncbi:MAG: sigma-54-dependent Fis family transcriptional regulator [Desulfatibacillum sp.]|nr:sigma-54-dependent Fis family transcriptional regulator [Desulfatibacillum sp.]